MALVICIAIPSGRRKDCTSAASINEAIDGKSEQKKTLPSRYPMQGRFSICQRNGVENEGDILAFFLQRTRLNYIADSVYGL